MTAKQVFLRLAMALFLALICGSAAAQRPQPLDWPRFGWDLARSSASAAPTGIAPSNLASLVRRQVSLDGVADASAIYLHAAQVKGASHDTFFVTTTYGKTIAVDASTGAILWEYTPPEFASWAGTSQITTATPVADPNRQYLYASSPDGKIQKLAVADGHLLWSTAITLLPKREKIASPLIEFHGHIVAVTGGYIGDQLPYQGHVAILDAAGGKLLHVWNSLCSNRTGLIEPASCPESDSAIWGRAGAVLDAKGDIYIATGNARWDGKIYWGDAVIELNPDATAMLVNYTPNDTAHLNDTDLDLGSTSPVLLGNGYVAQGGKDGLIRLLSAAKIAGTAPHQGGELQTVPTPSGTDLFTAPAVWRDHGETWIFAADNGGTAAWQLQNGKLVQKWKNANGGTSPMLAGGLLYVYAPKGGLRVYQPTSGTQLADLPCGPGHWNSPIAIDGRIALPEGNANRPTATGTLDIWTLPLP